MKRSELRRMIQETIEDMLPEIIEIISEEVGETIRESLSPTRGTSLIQTPDLTLVRKHVKSAMGNSGYDDFQNESVAPKLSSPGKPAPNPKAVLGGEVFASGKGIMEWFAKENGKLPIQSEFKVAEQDMDEFMKKRFGV